MKVLDFSFFSKNDKYDINFYTQRDAIVLRCLQRGWKE